MCCDSWGRKESDTTEQLNWTEELWPSQPRRWEWDFQNNHDGEHLFHVHYMSDTVRPKHYFPISLKWLRDVKATIVSPLEVGRLCSLPSSPGGFFQHWGQGKLSDSRGWALSPFLHSSCPCLPQLGGQGHQPPPPLTSVDSKGLLELVTTGSPIHIIPQTFHLILQ